MRRAIAIVVTLGAAWSQATLLTGCAGPAAAPRAPQSPSSAPIRVASEAENGPPSNRREAELYVGQGVGGCIGFYVRNGAVTGGFALPAKLNLSDARSRQLLADQPGSQYRTEAWPITRIRQLSHDTYIVMTITGEAAESGWFELVIQAVDDSALFYRMSPQGDRYVVAYSGTAINVDAMAAMLERDKRN